MGEIGARMRRILVRDASLRLTQSRSFRYAVFGVKSGLKLCSEWPEIYKSRILCKVEANLQTIVTILASVAQICRRTFQF